MGDETMSLLPAALRIANAREMKRPADLDEFGLRACRSDFTSSRGYRWPFPGKWAKAAGPFNPVATGGCPSLPGDGICVALSWDGMASGGMSADVVLLVGWRKGDVLGRDRTKVRVKRAYVVDAFTVAALLAERQEDEVANLCGANLRGANLRGADLRGADLCGALNKGHAHGLAGGKG